MKEPRTPAFVAKIQRALRGDGVFVVGGALRDRLLGRDTDDIDLALSGNPESAAKKLAAVLSGRAFPLHAERGIHRVVAGRRHVDLAKIQGSGIEDDLDRRDFSANALALPLKSWNKSAWKTAVLDRHDGLADIRKRRLVPVSKNVFKEDPLRLLRAFRIAAELDFTIPADAAALITRHKALATKPAAERQRDEFLRLFATPRAYDGLAGMEKSGLLDRLFPMAAALRRTAPAYYGEGGVLKHTLDSVKCFEDIVAALPSWFPKAHRAIRAYLDEKICGHPRLAHCKWALLLHDIGKPKTAKIIEGRLRFFEHEHVGADMIEALAPRFRWASEESDRYARFVRNHMRPGNLATHEPVTDKAVHRFFRDLEDDAVAMLLVSLADHLTYLTPAERRKRASAHEKVTIRMIGRFYSQPKKVLPERLLSGHDIMKAFRLEPSPLIGRLLSEAQDALVDGAVKTKADTLKYLRKRLPELQK